MPHWIKHLPPKHEDWDSDSCHLPKILNGHAGLSVVPEKAGGRYRESGEQGGR